MAMADLIREKKGKNRIVKRDNIKKKQKEPEDIIEIRGDFKPLFSFISDTHLNIHQYNLAQRAKDALDAAEQCLKKTHDILGDGGLVIHGGDVFNYPKDLVT